MFARVCTVLAEGATAQQPAALDQMVLMCSSDMGLPGLCPYLCVESPESADSAERISSKCLSDAVICYISIYKLYKLYRTDASKSCQRFCYFQSKVVLSKRFQNARSLARLSNV